MNDSAVMAFWDEHRRLRRRVLAIWLGGSAIGMACILLMAAFPRVARPILIVLGPIWLAGMIGFLWSTWLKRAEVLCPNCGKVMGMTRAWVHGKLQVRCGECGVVVPSRPEA
jgi:ribosomal protein S27AE